jgi:hypothetical protein
MEGMGKKYDDFLPNSANHALYDALSERVVQKLYPALETILKDLAELTAARP